MVEVAHHSGHIGISALPHWLAIIHALHHREQALVLLDVPRNTENTGQLVTHLFHNDLQFFKLLTIYQRQCRTKKRPKFLCIAISGIKPWSSLYIYYIYKAPLSITYYRDTCRTAFSYTIIVQYQALSIVLTNLLSHMSGI
jgi:hypothetical protein